MTCRETENLLPLFFDGELDPHQMRAVALHSARCTSCEQDLRHLERMQDLISENINRAVDAVDFDTFWSAIEPRLPVVRVPLITRLREWWDSGSERPWLLRLPAFAGAMAIAVLALYLFTRGTQPTAEPTASQVAAVDATSTIESLDTDVDSVAVLNDPETRTMVLWVNDAQNGDLP